MHLPRIPSSAEFNHEHDSIATCLCKYFLQKPAKKTEQVAEQFAKNTNVRLKYRRECAILKELKANGLNFANNEFKYSQRSRGKNKLILQGRLLIIKMKQEVSSGIMRSEFLEMFTATGQPV